MARSFDGTDDGITFGSDASIDDLGSGARSVAFWITWGTSGVGDAFLAKSNGADGWAVLTSSIANSVQMYEGTSATAGQWRGGTALGTGMRHVVVTKSATLATAPVIYIDGVAESITTVSTPTGTKDSDAANTLEAGAGSTTQDFLGTMQNLCYAAAEWTAAQVNRHRWWGRIGGAVALLQPFFTAKVANEGTATADGTVIGTTMVAFPRVQRPGGMMLMGCGF